MNTKTFFTEDQRKAIQSRIAESERLTSGEIRVHIDKRCKGDVIHKAVKVFKALKMHATDQHNGVLIYIAPSDKKFAILGDHGINEKVPEGFWDQALESMRVEFSTGRYTEGLLEAIRLAGEKLQQFFPYDGLTDMDELNNDISYGE